MTKPSNTKTSTQLNNQTNKDPHHQVSWIVLENSALVITAINYVMNTNRYLEAWEIW